MTSIVGSSMRCWQKNEILARGGLPTTRITIQKTRSVPTRLTKPIITASLAPAITSSIAPFAPAVLGGLTIGTVSLGKMLLLGRVLGISGTVKGMLIDGDMASWRFLFLSGLLAGGLVLRLTLPVVFLEGMAGEADLWRYIAAGFLVGYGTSLGNGCTSGHGVCGISRLSQRSMVATATFMVFGALSTAAMHAAGIISFPFSGIYVPSSSPPPEVLAVGKAAVASSIALLAAVTVASRTSQSDRFRATLSGFTELVSGLLFAVGLGVSGMTLPSKVLGFLGVLTGHFDPSLLFVMGSALLVAMPGYNLFRRALNCPVCTDAFSIPTNTTIDGRLLWGAALFGIGWGMAGLCPGPALVSLASGGQAFAVFAAMFGAGMALQRWTDTTTQMVSPSNQP